MKITFVEVVTPATGWLAFYAVNDEVVYSPALEENQVVEPIERAAKKLADILSADYEHYRIEEEELIGLIDATFGDEVSLEAAVDELVCDESFFSRVFSLTYEIHPETIERPGPAWPPPPNQALLNLYVPIGMLQEELESAGFCLTHDSLELFRQHIDRWLVGYSSLQEYFHAVVMENFYLDYRDQLLRIEEWDDRQSVQSVLFNPTPKTCYGELGEIDNAA